MKNRRKGDGMSAVVVVRRIGPAGEGQFAGEVHVCKDDCECDDGVQHNNTLLFM